MQNVKKWGLLTTFAQYCTSIKKNKLEIKLLRVKAILLAFDFFFFSQIHFAVFMWGLV